jgi:hypothetical protein
LFQLITKPEEFGLKIGTSHKSQQAHVAEKFPLRSKPAANAGVMYVIIGGLNSCGRATFTFKKYRIATIPRFMEFARYNFFGNCFYIMVWLYLWFSNCGNINIDLCSRPISFTFSNSRNVYQNLGVSPYVS